MCQTIATTDFVNRSEEVDKLHSLFDSENADLAVVCGRRRLGKTRLVAAGLIEDRLSATDPWLRRRVIAGLGVTVVFDIVTVLGAVLVVAIVALFTALPT
jgi:hypothetical protein